MTVLVDETRLLWIASFSTRYLHQGTGQDGVLATYSQFPRFDIRQKRCEGQNNALPPICILETRSMDDSSPFRFRAVPVPQRSAS
jgi:hypothetical protein